MDIEVEGVERLRFADGSPVRAASAVAAFGDGYLVVQDDATHGAWFHGGGVDAVRLLPAVEGLETFEEAAGTKQLKPDLEAACPVVVDGRPGVLALGSGSSPARMRWSLVELGDGRPTATVADMAPLYATVARALGVAADDLNLEGCCVVGDSLRWFHRGMPAAGLPSGSVDLAVEQAVGAVLGRAAAGSVAVTGVRRYDFGTVDGIGLAVTDAAVLPSGVVLVSAAAEDSPNPRDDGPVVGSALVVLGDDVVVAAAPLPRVEGEVAKVEGLVVLDADGTGALLLAVVDVDDPAKASLALRLRVRL